MTNKNTAGWRIKRRRIAALAAGCAIALGWTSGVVVAGTDRPTEFTNTGSIINTRHNMTQRNGAIDLLAGGPNAGGAGVMDAARNDYGEVCVYCHTPHGASATAAAPLWNRLLPNPGSFTTYAAVGSSTLTQTVTAPGGNSLPCLSCHDGTTAIDSILNMPGSGRYSANPDFAFLETWGFGGVDHLPLGQANSPRDGTSCVSCHSPGIPSAATNFQVFAIGTDLRDDHPIGVKFPGGTPDTTSFNSGYLTQNNVVYYDTDSNAYLNKKDPRFYDTGDGPEVECTSCHDPHGVPSGGGGSVFIPTFLRVSNNGSALCLTCHAK